MKKNIASLLTLLLHVCLLTISTKAEAAPCSSSEIIISRTADDNNPGSLRYAINQALAASTPLSLCANSDMTIPLTAALPYITKSLTLRASDQHVLTITRQSPSVDPFYSLFRIDSPSNNISVNLENVSFNNGVAFFGGVDIHDIRLCGGAIYIGSGDQLRITNSEFNLNTADFNGGAIYNDGGIVVINKGVFHNNNAPSGSGGAIYNATSGNLTLNRSQCYSNSASSQGGCVANFGTMAINNSSFVKNNITRGAGGAIYNIGSLSLRNVSIVDNFAGSGGGIENNTDARGTPGRISIVNTVMAYNRTNVTPRHDCRNSGGVITSRGSNLIQSTDYCSLTNNTSDFGNPDLIGVDPGYYNYGPTTYGGGNIPYPLLSSPLIDRGKQNECITAYNTDTDISGESRLGPCDIGVAESKINISLPVPEVRVSESNRTVSFTINQTSSLASNTVQYTTQDETGVSGRDYIASSGSISFSTFSTLNTLTLNLAADDTVHDGDKTFLVILSSTTPGVNIYYSRLIARVTIVDDEPLPVGTGGRSGSGGSGGSGGTSGSGGNGGSATGGSSGSAGSASGGTSGGGGVSGMSGTSGNGSGGNTTGSGGTTLGGEESGGSPGDNAGSGGSAEIDETTQASGGSSEAPQTDIVSENKSGGCSILY